LLKNPCCKGSSRLDRIYDCILWYSKDIEKTKYRPLFEERNKDEGEECAKVLTQCCQGNVQTFCCTLHSFSMWGEHPFFTDHCPALLYSFLLGQTQIIALINSGRFTNLANFNLGKPSCFH